MIFVAGLMLLEYRGEVAMCAEGSRRNNLCYTLFSGCIEVAFLFFVFRLQVNLRYIVTFYTYTDAVYVCHYIYAYGYVYSDYQCSLMF